MIIPLYEHLKTNPSYELIVFGLTAAQIKLKQKNIPFISYKNFSHLFPQSTEYGKNLSQLQQNSVDLPIEETYAYLGTNFYELVQEHGELPAWELYQKSGRFIFFPVKSMTKILQEVHPDIVVSTSSPRSERAALVAARDLEIKSICLVDAFDVKDMQPIVDLNLGTTVCVLNEFTQNLFAKLGRVNGIIQTGNPAFDHIYDPVYIEKAQAYRKSKGIVKKTMLLWARSALPQDKTLSNSIEAKLIEFASSNPEFAVVIRPHPNDILVIPENLPINVYFSNKDEDLYTVLHATDILYTLYSTVGVEACLIGKKVLQHTNTTTFLSFNLVSVYGAQGVETLDELPSIIKNVAEQRHSPQTIINSAVPVATHKISDILANLLGQ